MLRVSGIDSFIKDLKREVNNTRLGAVAQMKLAARSIMRELISRTPVWSGETVRNYAVGIGGGPTGNRGFIDNGPPGDTNNMDLGEEPRRDPNASAAMSEAEAVIGSYKDLAIPMIVGNTVDGAKWELIDSGLAPSPERVRYAAVISILAMQSARARLEHFK